MLSFRDKIRIRVMTAHSVLDKDLLGEVESELDDAIIACASQILGDDSQLITFFFAYHCP